MLSRHTSEIEKMRSCLPPVRTYASSSICHVRRIISKTHQIGIPHPHCIFHAYLAHQQTVHPAKGKLHEFDALRSEMLGERRVNARDKFCHAFDAALDTRLRAGVVVRDPVEQTREAPERVRFYGGQDGRREDRRINIFWICIWEAGSYVRDVVFDASCIATYRRMRREILRRTAWQGH